MNTGRWQYKTVHLKSSIMGGTEKNAMQMQETLNREGAQGWELVSTGVHSSGYFMAFLKKPL